MQHHIDVQLASQVVPVARLVSNQLVEKMTSDVLRLQSGLAHAKSPHGVDPDDETAAENAAESESSGFNFRPRSAHSLQCLSAQYSYAGAAARVPLEPKERKALEELVGATRRAEAEFSKLRTDSVRAIAAEQMLKAVRNGLGGTMAGEGAGEKPAAVSSSSSSAPASAYSAANTQRIQSDLGVDKKTQTLADAIMGSPVQSPAVGKEESSAPAAAERGEEGRDGPNTPLTFAERLAQSVNAGGKMELFPKLGEPSSTVKFSSTGKDGAGAKDVAGEKSSEKKTVGGNGTSKADPIKDLKTAGKTKMHLAEMLDALGATPKRAAKRPVGTPKTDAKKEKSETNAEKKDSC